MASKSRSAAAKKAWATRRKLYGASGVAKGSKTKVTKAQVRRNKRATAKSVPKKKPAKMLYSPGRPPRPNPAYSHWKRSQ